MHPGRGFTLIELLIVIVMMGLLTGLAVLSMSTADPRDQQKLEAERLVKLLELASQEAIARGEIMGLELFSQGYRFALIQNQKWHPETTDMIFKPRTLMPQMRLELVMNEQAVALKQKPAETVKPQPQINLTPDGDMELFQIRMTMENGDSIFLVSNTQEDGLTIGSENKP